MKTLHPYEDELWNVFGLLKRRSIRPSSVILDDAGPTSTPTFAEAAKEILSVDESLLGVIDDDGYQKWMLFVLGNSPGEIICDYSGSSKALEEVCDEHSARYGL
jgi:hypothetical protein